MNKTHEVKKITLEEYQHRYTHPENMIAAKTALSLLVAAVGVTIAVGLSFLVFRLFELHNLAGYIGTMVALVVYIFLFIAPVIKLNKTKSFLTNVNSNNARQAQKHNQRLREEIADKIIDVTQKANVIGWYSEDLVGKLAIARHMKNDEDLKSILKQIYQTDIRVAANKMIKNSAIKVGLATAISQSELVDTMFVIVYELNLIKDIVYLYGYRPNDSQMAKIYTNVLTNALIAYGIGSASVSVGKAVGSIVGTLGSAAGGLLAVVVDSLIQLGVNATLTVIIGNQTKKYLATEYNLQDMLDNIEITDTIEAQTELIESIKKEMKEKPAKKQKSEKLSTASTS